MLRYTWALVLYAAGLGSALPLHRAPAEAALHQYETDPLALRDSFATLAPHLQSAWVSSAAGRTLTDVLADLSRPLETNTALDIRLVGFNNDGDGNVTFKAADFEPFLTALRLDQHAHDLSRAENGTLPVRTHFVLSVSFAPRSLAVGLASALRAAVTSNASQGVGVVRVSHTVTDSLVAADHRATKQAYTLYLLNPVQPSWSYIYTYADTGDMAPGSSSSSGGGGCPASLWVGTARYAWVDLSAAPVAYGPRPSAGHIAGVVPRHGVATPQWFPRPKEYAKRPPTDMVAALLGVVRSAAAHLLAPPLSHYPVELCAHTRVAIIHVSDVVADTRDTERSPLQGLDAQLLRKELLGAQLAASSCSVEVHQITLGACDVCAVALAAATRAIAPHQEGDVTAADRAPPLRERTYIDAASLHEWLLKLSPRIAALPGLHILNNASMTQASGARALRQGCSHRTLPVFMFDLSRTDAVLLDGQHQAVAFPDMVLALRTRAGHVPAAAACAVGPRAEAAAFGLSGSAPSSTMPLAPPVLLDVGSITRPLLAAVLRAGWGVAPPHSGWSDHAGDFRSEYAWEVGHTPFGPWSNVLSLPFSTRDAAQRHVATSAQAQALGIARAALADLASLPGALAALPRQQVDVVRTRAEVLLQKLRVSAAASGHHQFDSAAYFARSAMHDAVAIETALHQGAKTMAVRLACGSPDSGWSYTLAIGAGALLLLWVATLAKRAMTGRKRHF